MRLERVLLAVRLVEILEFHFLVKIISDNTLENWDLYFVIVPEICKFLKYRVPTEPSP